MNVNVLPTGAIAPGDPLLAALIADLFAASGVVPIASFTWSLQNPATNQFLYRIVSVDGRRWVQTIWVDGTDPAMTFSVNDHWRLSEFEPLRDVRAAIVSLMRKYQSITSITITF